MLKCIFGTASLTDHAWEHDQKRSTYQGHKRRNHVHWSAQGLAPQLLCSFWKGPYRR